MRHYYSDKYGIDKDIYTLLLKVRTRDGIKKKLKKAGFLFNVVDDTNNFFKIHIPVFDGVVEIITHDDTLTDLSINFYDLWRY